MTASTKELIERLRFQMRYTKGIVPVTMNDAAGEIERAELVSELRESLLSLSLSELQHVAHFIDRLQSLRKAA